MAELLAKHSKLMVKEAEDEMTVNANQVYLISNDKFMTINKGKLYLSEKEKAHCPNLTINRFFNSLAADNGRKAIGVILSGLGSDGTEGIKSIKNAGGMVIARTPETTEFNSMPSNAIATGLVDFVVEPASMPDIIENYVKHSGNIFISDRSLINARNGIFKTDISEQISVERLEKFFTKENKNYKVNAEIRNMVIFAQHDLVKNPPYCNMHFISCRNLLEDPCLSNFINFRLFNSGINPNIYFSSVHPVPTCLY